MASRKKTDNWIKCICQGQGCGEVFYVVTSQIHHGRGKYCSPTCSSRAGGYAMRAKHPCVHRALNGDKAKRTYKIVNSAIQNGELQREPCVICGTTENICAHHKDYEKPFDITWFCKTHHVRYHMGLTNCWLFIGPHRASL